MMPRCANTRRRDGFRCDLNAGHPGRCLYGDPSRRWELAALARAADALDPDRLAAVIDYCNDQEDDDGPTP